MKLTQNPPLRVVNNQFGSPTFTDDLAEAITRLILTCSYGIYNLVNEGGCSRYEFAQAILEFAGKRDIMIEPITEYVRPAPIPPYVVLRNTRAAELGITLRPWREALQAYFSKD